MSMSYVRKYGVPAKRGMRIFYHYENRYGRILSAKGAHLRILLDGDKYAGIFHPTWELSYLDTDGTLLWGKKI